MSKLNLILSSIILLLSFSNLVFAQVQIEIRNTDIENISALTVAIECQEKIMAANFRTVGKTIFIEDKGCDMVHLSHIGFYDTTLTLQNANESHSVLLKPKVNELKEIEIGELQSFLYTEHKSANGKTLNYPLYENWSFYFQINLSKLEMKRLEELSVMFSNVDRSRNIQTTFFETYSDMINDKYLSRDTFSLKEVKGGRLKIFDYLKNNINLGDVFIVGFNIVPDTLNTNPEDNENATRIVSTFQEENASEYIKRGQGKEIYKTPNAHYFRLFNAYPKIVIKVRYGK